MPQTFYVDADEEVNSVIGKLRKSSAKHNILVIAQRALILQSSVSLRLIKNEMDLLDKKVMIVTQDERGLSVAKKIGFAVRSSMEGLKSDEQLADERRSDFNKEENIQLVKEEKQTSEKIMNKQKRLKNLGTKEFISVSGVVKRISNNDNNNVSPKKKLAKKVVNFKKSNNVNNKNNHNDLVETDKEEVLKLNKESEFRDLFINPEEDFTKDGKKDNGRTVVKKAGKIFWLFGIITGCLMLGVVAYLLMPKAEVLIFPKKIQKNINLAVDVAEKLSEVGEENVTDTIQLNSGSIEKNDTLSLTFKSTGEKTSSNQKARGKITIYNEFSEAGQILVATTRFLTEDGKLFRLTKTVTVPGMSLDENGQKKPGEIEAEVIADQSGEEYNIDATKFSIPGFEGGPKYDKFYAKSAQEMKGGGAENTELNTVSEDDIAKAKKETTEKIKEQIKEKMQEEIGENNILLDKAIKFEITDMANFPEEGAVADNFEYQIKIKAKGIFFSQNDLNEKINNYVSNHIIAEEKNYPLKIVMIDKEYGEPTVDFDNNSLKFNLGLNISLAAKINPDEVSQKLLGKNQEEIDEFISQHPEIQKIEATISPTFFANKIPKYISRVKMQVVE